MMENENTADITANLTDSEKLDLILNRLTRLETFVYATKPLPPNYEERFERVERQLETMGADIRGIREDLEAERRRRFHVEDRLTAPETHPS